MAGPGDFFSDPVSFIYGGNTGLSYSDLQRRRQIAIALASRQRKFPTNVGEGLTYLGEGIGEMLAERRLAAAEGQYKAGEDERERGYTPSTYIPGSVAAPPVTAPATPSPGAPAGAPAGTAANPIQAPAAPDVNTMLNPAAGALPLGGIGAVSPVPAVQPVRAVAPPPRAGMDVYGQGIAGIESGGARDPYALLGVRTRTGDRAIGKYQIMGANVPNWTEAALGRRMTPQEFRADPEAQEATFRNRFGQYVDKYGPEGAARAWYAGEKGMKNLGATDVHGRLTVADYGQDFMRRLGGAQGPAGVPAGSRDAIAAQMAAPPQGPPTPQELASQEILQETVGVGGGGPLYPPTASAGRAGVTTDAPSVGASPLGAVTNPSIGDTLQRQRGGGVGGIMPPAQPTVLPQVAQVRARSVPVTASDAAMAPLAGSVAPPAGFGAARSAQALPSDDESIPPDMSERPYPRRYKEPPKEAVVHGPDAAMLRDQRIATGDYSPGEKSRAEERLKQATYFMQLKNARAQEAAKNYREAYEAENKAETEWKHKAPERKLETRLKQLETQKAIADRKNDPVTALQLQATLDVTRENLAKLRREAQKPETVGAKGTEFERPAGATPDTPFRVRPGLPQPTEDSLTSDQAKGVEFVLRTAGDLAKLETMDNGKILAMPLEAGRDVPVFGNLLVSQQYQTARNAANNWGAGFIQRVSGAAVSPSEADRNLPAFLPRPGDSDEELAAKAQRRRSYTEAVSRTSGREGLKVIEQEVKKLNEDYTVTAEGKKPPLQIKSPDDLKGLPPGRRIILPDGSPGIVPRDK